MARRVFIDMHRLTTLPLAAVLAISLIGCQLITAGGCDHTYRDPLISITRAMDASTGARLSLVTLSDFSVNGSAVPLLQATQPSVNIAIGDSALVCTVRCGFATSEGTYRFTVSAPLYTSTSITLDARYDRFHGGCPSYNEGGHRIEVRLQRIAGSSSAP